MDPHLQRPYELKPIKIGCEVSGIDLKQNISSDIIQLVKEDVKSHRLLVFRNQGVVSPSRHLEIGRWFGEIESTFYNHSRSPHRDIFRVSNDREQGCTGVGRTGWHIDGSFMSEPFTHSIYHIIECPKKGATVFLPLTEFIQRLDQDTFDLWNRLYMVSDRRRINPHPLVYKHPETQKLVMCFHLGMTDLFIVDHGGSSSKQMTDEETETVLGAIHDEIVNKNADLIYKHEWKPGDFIISDNLAIGHEASPETQYPISKVGLRVMHRVTIKGKYTPNK